MKTGQIRTSLSEHKEPNAIMFFLVFLIILSVLALFDWVGWSGNLSKNYCSREQMETGNYMAFNALGVGSNCIPLERYKVTCKDIHKSNIIIESSDPDARAVCYDYKDPTPPAWHMWHFVLFVAWALWITLVHYFSEEFKVNYIKVKK